MIQGASLLPRIAAFAVSVVLGTSLSYVATQAISSPGPSSSAVDDKPGRILEPSAGTLDAPDATNLPIGFDLESPTVPPVNLEPLKPDTLAAVSEAMLGDEQPSWLEPHGYPRVRPISQFDGGRFARANCTLAAGAMLARLAFGIVTTGSILRDLQFDNYGGTGLDDLSTALARGYNAKIDIGSISFEGLRKLSSAGYGVVIQGIYARIPRRFALQAFTGPHAIYIDGFYPGDADTPPLYYVIDPLGRPHSRYQGDWWPASSVEQFAEAFGGTGRVTAAWAYPPGGAIPPPVDPDFHSLPPSGGNAPPSNLPSSPPGSSTPSGSPSSGPGSSPPPDLSEAGNVDEPEPSASSTIDDDAKSGGVDLQPNLQVCLAGPIPAACPAGVPAVYPGKGGGSGLAPPGITILYVDSDAPNVAFVGFSLTGSAATLVEYWRADQGAGIIQAAPTIPIADLIGPLHYAAKLSVLAGTKYEFVVVAIASSGIVYSPVGSFTTGPGLADLKISLHVADDPVFRITQGESPYAHLATDGYAPPLLACSAVSATGCTLLTGATIDCSLVATFDARQLCLPTIAAAALQPACRTAVIHYALVGVTTEGVRIRAYPTALGLLADGSPTTRGILETAGPNGPADVSIGCLADGLSYTVVIDAIGDDRGPLEIQTIGGS